MNEWMNVIITVKCFWGCLHAEKAPHCAVVIRSIHQFYYYFINNAKDLRQKIHRVVTESVRLTQVSRVSSISLNVKIACVESFQFHWAIKLVTIVLFTHKTRTDTKTELWPKKTTGSDQPMGFLCYCSPNQLTVYDSQWWSASAPCNPERAKWQYCYVMKHPEVIAFSQQLNISPIQT